MEGNERPIKFNPNGKYNMDFIDWNNDLDAMCDYSSGTDEEYKDLPLEECKLKIKQFFYIFKNLVLFMECQEQHIKD